MKAILTLEIDYYVDGEYTGDDLDAEVRRLLVESIPSVLDYYDNDDTGYAIIIDTIQELPSSGWIPCDADNPPPAEIPDGMLMAVWAYMSNGHYKPVLVDPVDNEWATVGQPGYDFSHYLLIPKPAGQL